MEMLGYPFSQISNDNNSKIFYKYSNKTFIWLNLEIK